MIKYIKGDLFSSPAQVLVNTVNLDGVMGKGIALQFKKLYPEMFKKYQAYCEQKLLQIGKLWIYKTPNKWILNFPTKNHWRNKSKMEYIEKGLQKFVDTYADRGITSVAFPKLGCGNGGLEWQEVKPVMDRYLKNLPIDIFIYEDQFDKQKEYMNIQEMKTWLSNSPQELSFYEFKEDIKEIASKRSINMNDIKEDELEDFWSNFKGAGFITREDKIFINNKIYQLASQLEYVVPCQIATGLNGKLIDAIQLRKPSTGEIQCQNLLEFNTF
ncbi:macro domain-containing protein [uncultured Dubosiella sp.]|uniref:macro domain-containing protein n=1 Tax=uncultured Dubosiella sp. TaxID=1937011 RepID=UPI0025B500DB|nr:macro domain-containing protein [uncultured Dubosiella sp.]